MRIKLIVAFIAAIAVSGVACATALAEYEGPVWVMNGSLVLESLVVKLKSTTNLKIEDTKAGAVECHVSGEAKVGAEGKGEITSATASECLNVKSCEGAITVKAAGLPWTTQLKEVGEEGETRATEKPTWIVECHILGVLTKDECTGETTEKVENATEGGVDSSYDSGSARLKCSVGGVESGVLTGTDLDESTAENTLQMQEPYVTSLNAGNGVPLFNEAYCEYTVINQECWIEFRNRANVNVIIVEKEIAPPEASTRYEITSAGCTILLELTVGAGCVDLVKLKVTPGTNWNNGYVVRAETLALARGSGILSLRTP